MQNSVENPTSTKGQSAPAIAGIDISKLRRLYGDNYGTSGYGIIHADPDVAKSEALMLIAWENNCQREDMNPREQLVEGIGLVKKTYADFNSFKHLCGKYDAEWAIHLGKTLRQMKVLAKKAGFMWEAWAAENLPFIGKRNRSNFMNLARRVDCHPYTFLGVDRLSVLCAATSESKDADPIGSFLQKHSIEFDPASEFNLDDFKIQVDTALNRERLLKNGIDVDISQVKALTISGKKFEKSFIRKMKDINESGGDLSVFLEKVTMTGGVEPLEDEGEKHLQDFGTLSARLIATIDYLVTENTDEIDKIDPETFLRLIKKLSTLQKLGNFADETSSAA